MQIIAADVGNSSIKCAIGQQSERDGTVQSMDGSCSSIDLDQCADFPVDSPSHWFVSSVNAENLNRLKELAQEHHAIANWSEIDHRHVPMEIDLEDPQAVGIDRLLAALAAKRLHAGDNHVIVIDCGTALTIDLVDRRDVFRGGVIIAGPAASLLALSQLTAALPDLSDSAIARPTDVVGRSTAAAMRSGAYFNGLGAIKEVVREISSTLDRPPRVVGTGGGIGPWRDALPNDWTLVKNLVLDGIFLVSNQWLSQS